MPQQNTDNAVSRTSSYLPFLKSRHLLEPDFSGPRLEISQEKAESMKQRLALLYGKGEMPEIYEELERVLKVHHAYMTPEIEQAEAEFDVTERFTEEDVILITYGDLIVSSDDTPLSTLARCANRLFRGLITTIHILPFFPYSSDRGFSVINYGEVDPRMGTWEDISELKKSFKLMFDGVVNHCSAKCKWFRRYISGDPDYQCYFLGFDSPDAIDDESMKKILRPRTSPLLSKFDTINGPRYVWTTFSRDQVDLNFKSPRVLLKIVRILLDYVRRGADIIRLDAITYLWREIGTTCAHLEQTHEVVKLLRDILDTIAPHVALISETNVPHSDNITYFGNGDDEAQMVYNFALPPLVLHTFLKGDASVLSRWAKELVPPSKTTAFFNFLDSHDGIGILGARDYLTEDDINSLCETVKSKGGFVSMKDNGDGTQSPYELNTTWFSALQSDDENQPQEIQVDRFVASRAVALVLRGVPGIYLLSMFASKNDLEAVSRDGVSRSINRSTLFEERIVDMFLDRNSIERKIAEKYMNLLELRVNDPAFHPGAPQKILDLGNKVFAIKRASHDGESQALCVINVTDKDISVDLPLSENGMDGKLCDMITGRKVYPESDPWKVDLEPYQILWLKKRQ